MNAARARRRWQAWLRYCNQLIELSHETVATPGMEQAYNEWVYRVNSGVWGVRGARRWRRINRRTKKGARR